MSTRDDIVTKTTALAEPILMAEGLELIDVEWAKEGPSWVLRLFVDKPGGIGLDDCQKASHAVETAIDVADFISHEYSLEVSSPGVNRPLTKDRHFLAAIGQRVRIKTYGPLGDPPRKNYLGVLTAFADGAAEVDVEGAGRFRVPLKDIAKANIEFDFNTASPRRSTAAE